MDGCSGSRPLIEHGEGGDNPPLFTRPVSAAPAEPRTAAPVGVTMTGNRMFLAQPDRKFFPPSQAGEMPRTVYGSGQESRLGFQQWVAGGRSNGMSSSDAIGTDEEDDDDDEDGDHDVEDGDGKVEGLGPIGNDLRKERLNSSTSAQSSSEKICHDKATSQEDQSSFCSSRGGSEKDNGNSQGSMNRQESQQRRMVQCENAIAIAEPETYYAQNLQGGDVSSFSQKEAEQVTGCGFSGRKNVFSPGGFGETLRKHLSDPITGVLMDDAMILPCGHSYGSSGMLHIVRMKVCSKCDQPFSENSFRPNLALRSAVHAFLREEEAQYIKSSKRRRERLEQDKCNLSEILCVDSRGKGVQFPFVVSDRVIIKGNKRTPPRFVGRLAVVTSQCLNGWYVVKTLDNADSVKVQYRSLAKAPSDAACNVLAGQTTAPKWL